MKSHSELPRSEASRRKILNSKTKEEITIFYASMTTYIEMQAKNLNFNASSGYMKNHFINFQFFDN